MAPSSLAIIGRSRLAEELLQIGRDKGLETTLYPDAEKVPPSSPIVVETFAGAHEEKERTVKKLDSVLRASSTILTSCLGLSTTAIASWTSRPERIVGFAAFYPLKGKGVIECACGLRTRQDALDRGKELIHDLGLEAVVVKDSAGLVFPRILSLIINEAVRSLDEGVATAEDIDVALRLGTNYPQGPLRWADQIGLDEVLAVLEGLERETGDDRYRPTPLLKKLVLAGWLGETNGRGFYQYGA